MKKTIGWFLIALAVAIYFAVPPEVPIRTSVAFTVFGIALTTCGGDDGDRVCGIALLLVGLLSCYIEIPFVSGM